MSAKIRLYFVFQDLAVFDKSLLKCGEHKRCLSRDVFDKLSAMIFFIKQATY